MTFHTFTATLPDGKPLTKKSTKPLTHVVVGMNHKDHWYDLAWVDADHNADKVAANKTKSQGDWYTNIQALPCAQVEDKPKPEAAPHTCQLCGRHIHDNTGRIAQHGYEINYGTEIHTCRGSHHLAYEFDCSLIGPEIEMLKRFIADKEAWLADFIANPPAEIVETYLNRKKEIESKTYTRPDGFTSGDETHRSYYSTDRYEYRFLAKRMDAAGQIAQAKHDQAWHEARLAAWKAPTAE